LIFLTPQHQSNMKNSHGMEHNFIQYLIGSYLHIQNGNQQLFFQVQLKSFLACTCTIISKH
jgi:hypothetical protein